MDFHAVTEICALPRYMNLALFRAIEQNDVITLEQFKEYIFILVFIFIIIVLNT